MWHRHRRCAHRRLAINLGGLAFRQGRITAHQPEATHGEASEIISFRDAGALQQWQSTTTGTKKHEWCPHFLFPRGPLEQNPPVPLGHVGLAQPLQVLNLGAVAQLESTALLQRQQISLGECTEIDIGAALDPGCRHRLLRIPSLHHQGHPLRQLDRVLAPAHR